MDWAFGALAGLFLVWVLRRVGVRYLPVYVVLGVAVWFATLESGVHATIAGVALGLLTPARPLLEEPDADRIADELSEDHAVTAGEIRAVSFRLRESVSVAERLQDLLHPYTSFFVIPVFAPANAGVRISIESVGDAASSSVSAGVAVGLVVGKVVGVTGAVALAVRFGIGRLPEGVAPRHVLGMSAIAGIGFTVSLFIAGLAFGDDDLEAEAKLGILAASAAAAVLGASLLLSAPLADPQAGPLEADDRPRSETP